MVETARCLGIPDDPTEQEVLQVLDQLVLGCRVHWHAVPHPYTNKVAEFVECLRWKDGFMPQRAELLRWTNHARWLSDAKAASATSGSILRS